MEINNSGKGNNLKTPSGLKKWNWGAFFLTWIWGLGNGTFIPLLSLLPILNFIMPFYLGINGHRMAWESRYWSDVASCNRTQRKWGIAGLIWHVFLIVLLLLYFHSARAHHLETEGVKNDVISAIEASMYHEIIDENTSIDMTEFSMNDISPEITMYLINSDKASYMVTLQLKNNDDDIIQLINLANDDVYYIHMK